MLSPILKSKTLRVWIPNTISDILGDLSAKSLSDIVLDAVPLEDHELIGSYDILSGRPQNSILADLAVHKQGWTRVLEHYRLASLEVGDLSLVIPSEESNDPDTLSRRQHDQVYSKYLQQQAKRQFCDFPNLWTRDLVLAWYQTRLYEVSDARAKLT